MSRNLGYELRLALIKILAPDAKCAKCGHGCYMPDLEVDHVNGRTVLARSLNSTTRAKRYWLEYATGVRLRALCRRCNALDGTRRQWLKNHRRTA